MAVYVELLNGAYVQKFAENEEVRDGRVLPKYGIRGNEDIAYMMPPPQKNRVDDGKRFKKDVCESFFNFWNDIENTFQAHKEEVYDLMGARQLASRPSTTLSTALPTVLPIALPTAQIVAAFPPGVAVENVVDVCSAMPKEDKKQLIRILLQSLDDRECDEIVTAFSMLRSATPEP